MSTLGDRIRKLRKKKSLTQDELASLMNVNRATLANWEINRAVPDLFTLQRFADFFNVSTDYLLGRNDTPKTPKQRIIEKTPQKEIDILETLEDDNVKITAGNQPITREQRISILRALINPTAPPTDTLVRIPILGNIRAGLPIMARDHWVGELDIPADIIADFALRVEGDSMIGAGIHEGDFAICRKAEVANSGNIVVALRDISESQGEATLKYYFQDKGKGILRAANPEFEDIVMEEEGYRVAGIMVALLRKTPPGYSIYREYISTRDYTLKAWDEVIETASAYGIKPDKVKAMLDMHWEMNKK